jgi:DNA replication protein DnaC
MSELTKTAVQAIIERSEQGGPAAETFVGEDGLRRCAKCRQPVEAVIKSMGGQIRSIPCACVRNRDEAERQDREHRERVDAARRMSTSSPCYDPSYERYTFASDQHRDEDGFREAGDKCRSFVEHFDELKTLPAGMLLTGPVGTGKSFYASAIVNALREQGVSAMIVSTSRLLNVIRSNGNRQTIIDDLNSFDLVALDDLGAERDTDYAIEQLEAFVDARALAEKPLIVTTNLTVNDIRKPSDMRYVRLFDRINSLCVTCVPLVQYSLREEQARDRRAKAKAIMNQAGPGRGAGR